MAVETYSWRSQLGAGAIEYSQTVRAAQFGDGYEQVAENGINSTAIQVPMKHTGAEAEVTPFVTSSWLIPLRLSSSRRREKRRALSRSRRFCTEKPDQQQIR
jgi:hypothetical protein